MSDAKKPGRFTMLEACRPNNPPPGSEAWPVVELANATRFTMLEAKGPNNPPPGSEAWPVAELANAVQFGMPPDHGLSEPVVDAVRRLDAAGLRSLRALIDERLREIGAGSSPDPTAS